MDAVIVYYLWILAHVITGAIIAYLLLPLITGMLRDAGVVMENYRGNSVVNMSGLVIIASWLIMMALVALARIAVDASGIMVPQGFILPADIAMPLTIIIIGAGLFGMLDDRLGTRDYCGFKGHFGALFKGTLTTGALKALGIPLVALIAVSLTSTSIFDLMGNAIFIALVVNALNLFDLRPGRALKLFIPLQLIVMVLAISAIGTSSAALLGIALALLLPDLREQTMLGDTGSNILGGVLGFCAAAAFGWSVKIPLLVVLVTLQLLAERVSISKVIEGTPVLKALDNIGRRQ